MFSNPSEYTDNTLILISIEVWYTRVGTTTIQSELDNTARASFD